MAVIGILLVVWLVLPILGAVLERLFWLAIVGVILFLGTAAYGVINHRSGKKLS